MSVVSSYISTRVPSSRINVQGISLMDHIFAISFGLGLRVIIDSVSHQDVRLTGTLVGLWEGVVMQHFLKKTPNSFDPYVAYGVRLFVDFLFTESLKRLVLTLVWTGMGVVLADVAPAIWFDAGFHRYWRRFRRDLYIISQSVPSISLFTRPRTVRFSPIQLPSEIAEPPAPASVVTTSIQAPTFEPPTPRLSVPGPAVARRRFVPGYFPGEVSETETELGSVLGLQSSDSNTARFRYYPRDRRATVESASDLSSDLDEANVSSEASYTPPENMKDMPSIEDEDDVDTEREVQLDRDEKKDDETTPKQKPVGLPTPESAFTSRHLHDESIEIPPVSAEVPIIPDDDDDWDKISRQDLDTPPPPVPPKDSAQTSELPPPADVPFTSSLINEDRTEGVTESHPELGSIPPDTTAESQEQIAVPALHIVEGGGGEQERTGTGESRTHQQPEPEGQSGPENVSPSSQTEDNVQRKPGTSTVSRAAASPPAEDQTRQPNTTPLTAQQLGSAPSTQQAGQVEEQKQKELKPSSSAAKPPDLKKDIPSSETKEVQTDLAMSAISPAAVSPPAQDGISTVQQPGPASSRQQTQDKPSIGPSTTQQPRSDSTAGQTNKPSLVRSWPALGKNKIPPLPLPPRSGSGQSESPSLGSPNQASGSASQAAGTDPRPFVRRKTTSMTDTSQGPVSKNNSSSNTPTIQWTKLGIDRIPPTTNTFSPVTSPLDTGGIPTLISTATETNATNAEAVPPSSTTDNHTGASEMTEFERDPRDSGSRALPTQQQADDLFSFQPSRLSQVAPPPPYNAWADHGVEQQESLTDNPAEHNLTGGEDQLINFGDDNGAGANGAGANDAGENVSETHKLLPQTQVVPDRIQPEAGPSGGPVEGGASETVDEFDKPLPDSLPERIETVLAWRNQLLEILKAGKELTREIKGLKSLDQVDIRTEKEKLLESEKVKMQEFRRKGESWYKALTDKSSPEDAIDVQQCTDQSLEKDVSAALICLLLKNKSLLKIKFAASKNKPDGERQRSILKDLFTKLNVSSTTDPKDVQTDHLKLPLLPSK